MSIDENNELSESIDESAFHVKQKHTSKTPAISANMVNIKVDFLIDTGASVNILNKHDYDKLKPLSYLSKKGPRDA